MNFLIVKHIGLSVLDGLRRNLANILIIALEPPAGAAIAHIRDIMPTYVYTHFREIYL